MESFDFYFPAGPAAVLLALSLMAYRRRTAVWTPPATRWAYSVLVFAVLISLLSYFLYVGLLENGLKPTALNVLRLGFSRAGLLEFGRLLSLGWAAFFAVLALSLWVFRWGADVKPSSTGGGGEGSRRASARAFFLVFLALAVSPLFAVLYSDVYTERPTEAHRSAGRGPGPPSSFFPLRVAHAGGGYKGKAYTNSFEALEHNLGRGFRYFELDFSMTSDGRLVCIHDWGKSFENLMGFEPEAVPTEEEFEEQVLSHAGYDICTLGRLAEWMEANPEAYLITDVKNTDNVEALGIIAREVEDYERRVIPQIYRPRNYGRVKRMGYERIIWTLYAYGVTDDDVVLLGGALEGPLAITMPRGRAASDLPERLARLNIPTYAHTVNDPAEMESLVINHGVTNIYTDHLPPD